MSKKPTALKPGLTTGRALAALLGAALLFAYSLATGWAGRAAALAALAVLPAATRSRQKATWLPIAAGLIGGLVGGFIEGSEDVPPGGLVGDILHMLHIVSVRAIMMGVMGAGLACTIVATWLWFRRVRRAAAGAANAASLPRLLVEGVGVLACAFLYSCIALIAIPGFSGGNGRVARYEMTGTFNNIAYAEKMHFDSTATFTATPSYAPPRGVTVAFTIADSTGWAATATTPSSTTTCSANGKRGDTTDPHIVCTAHRRWF